MKAKAEKYRIALIFLFLMGLVSLFSDITYEGMRSIIGPYLGLLGASAFLVSFVAGFSELFGYGMRLVFGRVVDKTKKYWLFTFIGYVMNLLVIPTLALTNHWVPAIVLVVLERLGKAIRKPSKDTITSFVGGQLGYGKTFAIEEFLDQIGATVGPLFVSFAISRNVTSGTLQAYKTSFALLAFPALITLGVLTIARLIVPSPERLEKTSEVKAQTLGENKALKLYLFAISLFAFSFADFALIGYHVQSERIFSASTIPLLYASAMAIDALSALLFGWMFDKRGFNAMVVPVFLSAFYGILSFSSTKGMIWLGVLAWGIGMGAQESIFKAAIAKLVAKELRATAYGVYNTVFGVSWFLGSAFIGLLYEHNIVVLRLVTLILGLASFGIFYALSFKTSKKSLNG
ncbi:MFS transporter [Fervidobacterium thailandense]|uniref:MFS transporter n=1 Tax=Fervidobacterium thailandense TaxID=1008305 RepID=A0A1E3G592_9BACT|nr:MFS transporter [Fervidobacterium thailandense]ODN31013.1 MFS transporter [Fervidobacterium thailandense]